MKVLQISGAAQGGGAERMAYALYEGIGRRDATSWMAVARRNIDEPGIFAIPGQSPGGVWGQAVTITAAMLAPLVGRVKGVGRIQKAVQLATTPAQLADWWRGRECFDFPGTGKILDVPPSPPDIVHCHNLHGRYFDLRELERLSRRVPVVMTLHDEWTFTGHCAYTIGCERWRNGCGSCPDLAVYPPIRKDATAANLSAKRTIYKASRLYVSTPSEWLMERARGSALAEGMAGARVINNGVDLNLFKPWDRGEARRLLGLPEAPMMLLFTANAARRNVFKDHQTVFAAARRAAEQLPGKRLLLIALGDSGPTETIGNAELRFVAYEKDPMRVAAYYQASDLYLHAAHADNFPTTILEALATGVPAIATAVGGIGEQIFSLDGIPGGWTGPAFAINQATGALVAGRDVHGMASATIHLLAHDDVRRQLAANAVADARRRFDIERQIDETVGWYRDIIGSWQAPRASA